MGGALIPQSGGHNNERSVPPVLLYFLLYYFVLSFCNNLFIDLLWTEDENWPKSWIPKLKLKKKKYKASKQEQKPKTRTSVTFVWNIRSVCLVPFRIYSHVVARRVQASSSAVAPQHRMAVQHHPASERHRLDAITPAALPRANVCAHTRRQSNSTVPPSLN